MVFGFGKRTRPETDVAGVSTAVSLAQLAAQADGQFSWQAPNACPVDEDAGKGKQPLPYSLQQHKVKTQLKVGLCIE